MCGCMFCFVSCVCDVVWCVCVLCVVGCGLWVVMYFCYVLCGKCGCVVYSAERCVCIVVLMCVLPWYVFVCL